MKHVRSIPELFFVGVLSVKLLKNLFQSGGINYIFLLVIWLLLLQLVYKSKWLGIIYGNLFGVFCIYSFGELLYYFPFANTNTFTELLYLAASLLIYGMGIFMSGKMLYNYFTAEENYAENEFTISF